MPSRSSAEWFAPLSVPVAVFATVVAFGAVVPPLASGPISVGEAYTLTLVILILAVGYGVPYAVAVAVVTLPVLRFGVADYASPELADRDASTTVLAAVHVVVGFLYALAAAFVGSLALGAQIAGSPDTGFAFPFGPLGGGLLVGGAYVAAQLWRGRRHDPRTVAVTLALGGLLAASPVVVVRLFGAM